MQKKINPIKFIEPPDNSIFYEHYVCNDSQAVFWIDQGSLSFHLNSNYFPITDIAAVVFNVEFYNLIHNCIAYQGHVSFIVEPLGDGNLTFSGNFKLIRGYIMDLGSFEINRQDINYRVLRICQFVEAKLKDFLNKKDLFQSLLNLQYERVQNCLEKSQKQVEIYLEDLKILESYKG